MNIFRAVACTKNIRCYHRLTIILNKYGAPTVPRYSLPPFLDGTALTSLPTPFPARTRSTPVVKNANRPGELCMHIVSRTPSYEREQRNDVRKEIPAVFLQDR